MLEQLKNRLLLLNQAIEQSLTAHQGLVARVDEAKNQSLGNHNALIGRKIEIEEMLKHFSDLANQPPPVPPIDPCIPEAPTEPEVPSSEEKNLEVEHE